MTLIELIIVIIVLAIISAIAAPRFVDIKTDAVAAAQAGTRGGVMSTYTVSVGKDLGTPTWATFTGRLIDMTCVTIGGTCVSDDFDKDTNKDIQYIFYSDAGCVTPIALVTDKVYSYKEGAVNAAPVALDPCVELR